MHELFHVGTKQEMKIAEEEETLDDMSPKAKSPSSLKQSIVHTINYASVYECMHAYNHAIMKGCNFFFIFYSQKN